MSTALCAQPIGDQISAVRSGALSAEALVSAVRAQIERDEPRLQAWVELSPDAVEHARRVDREPRDLPLSGISFGVKDLIDVAGMPTRAGSPITSPQGVRSDADCVARLRALGAIVQGKTVTTEFGYFAPGPTRNPYHRDHTPGGSSSGSAAAVGAGSLPLALGTQTAGSLTRPASYCGTAGMVLAPGATSMAGITGLSGSLDSLGLLTRSIEDLRHIYAAFTGQSGAAAADSSDAPAVFIWNGSALGEMTPAMAHLVQQLPNLVSELGGDHRPLVWDSHIHALAEDHAIVMAYEAARSRATEFEQHGDALSVPLRELLEHGREISPASHSGALARRDHARALLSTILAGDSVIVGPAALGPAPKGLSATGSPILSRPWQLLGLPVVVVPGARTEDGLPLGLQLIGLPGQEQILLDLGARLEVLLRGLPAMTDSMTIADKEPSC